ncbi:hypothetical protein G6F22_017407 [Rhizopus arrhizus]|nr:hypothetical protein G6F22_017407 [Rhizopus arrhizus]
MFAKSWLFRLPALALAIAASFRLAHRILSPLNSLVDSVRALASGDLGARASVEENSPGEVATLVEDFNAMARRLQHMESERAMWHAAIAHELRTPVTILLPQPACPGRRPVAPDRGPARAEPVRQCKAGRAPRAHRRGGRGAFGDDPGRPAVPHRRFRAGTGNQP